MPKCISCGVEAYMATKFHCPKCGKVLIVRCQKCKNNAEIYICPECGFKGP